MADPSDARPVPPLLPVLPVLPVVRVAAVALTDGRGRVLLARRPPGKSMAGLWEFPGGKIEEGETAQVALVRELAEELGVGVAIADLSLSATASHAYDDFHLEMPLFRCRRWRGMPTPKEGQLLEWVHPREMGAYAMPPADAPLVARLLQGLKPPSA